MTDSFWCEFVVFVDVSEPEPVFFPVDADNDTFRSDLVVGVETFFLANCATSELYMIARNDVPKGDAILGQNEFGAMSGVGRGSDGELFTFVGGLR